MEPLLEDELFVMLPRHSRLVPQYKKALTITEVAALPLILPTSMHGLRQRIATEFENRGLITNVVAEIDSLSLLMNCVYDDMGATIKPMGAVMQEGARGRKWRALAISDARMRRRNFIYSLPPERLSTAASVVATELKEIVRELLESKAWPGIEALTPLRAREPSRSRSAAKADREIVGLS